MPAAGQTTATAAMRKSFPCACIMVPTVLTLWSKNVNCFWIRTNESKTPKEFQESVSVRLGEALVVFCFFCSSILVLQDRLFQSVRATVVQKGFAVHLPRSNSPQGSRTNKSSGLRRQTLTQNV